MVRNDSLKDKNDSSTRKRLTSGDRNESSNARWCETHFQTESTHLLGNDSLQGTEMTHLTRDGAKRLTFRQKRLI